MYCALKSSHCIVLANTTQKITRNSILENTLQILIRSDNNIHVNAERATELEAIVEHAMRHCSQHVTRVEMHLSDINGAKPGQMDKSCVMEVRLEGHQPMAVTEHANTVGESVSGAAEKLARTTKSTLGKATARRPPAPDPIQPDGLPEELE